MNCTRLLIASCYFKHKNNKLICSRIHKNRAVYFLLLKIFYIRLKKDSQKNLSHYCTLNSYCEYIFANDSTSSKLIKSLRKTAYTKDISDSEDHLCLAISHLCNFCYSLKVWMCCNLTKKYFPEPIVISKFELLSLRVSVGKIRLTEVDLYKEYTDQSLLVIPSRNIIRGDVEGSALRTSRNKSCILS